MGKSNTAENALLMIEVGQDFVDWKKMDDSGDRKMFESGATLWSGRSGYTPEVRPNGLVTGGEVSPHSDNDKVVVSALTAYQGGQEKAISGTDKSVTRSTESGEPYIINSVIINTDGELEVKQGETGSSFSGDRGADGGPPWIPVGAIEIAQVRLSSDESGVVADDEIRQIPGVSVERYDYPVWDEDSFEGEITFVQSLPEIHSDDNGTTTTTKDVWVQYYEPILTDAGLVTDFVPPEVSHSVTSQQVYRATIASRSQALAQGEFTAYLRDGISDLVIGQKDEQLWFKFYPDANRSQHILCQGALGISRQFPADDSIFADCTISASEAARNVR